MSFQTNELIIIWISPFAVYLKANRISHIQHIIFLCNFASTSTSNAKYYVANNWLGSNSKYWILLFIVHIVHLSAIPCHKSQFLTSPRKNVICMRMRLAQRLTPSKNCSMFDFTKYTYICISSKTVWWSCYTIIIT